MFDEYTFRQAKNGWVVTKGTMSGMYMTDIWVFNSSSEMGQWVSQNLLPADAAQPPKEDGNGR